QVEKGSVKPFGVFQDGARFDQVRIVCRRRTVKQGPLQFLVFEKGDGLDAVTEIAPELLEVLRAREASGHADDSDAFGLGFRRIHNLTRAPNCFCRGRPAAETVRSEEHTSELQS